MVTTYVRTLRLFGRDLRIFLASSGLVSLAWDGVRAVILNLYLLRLGYGPKFVGMFSAVGALAFALSCPVAGALGTRWCSRKMIVAGASLLATGFLLLSMAEFLAGPWRTAWLLATSILAQFGGSLYMVNSLPFMMGATGAEERPYAFSVHFALIPLAAFVGSLIAGVLPGVFAGQRGLLLEQAAPYRLTLWVAALLLFPGALLLLRTRPAAGQQTRGVPPSHSAPPANRVPYALIAAIALIMGLRFGGRATTLTFFNVYLDDGLGISTALIGTLTALAQLLSVPVALCAPLLVGRWGNARIIFLGTLGSGLSVLLLALFPHWVPAGIGFVSSNALFAMTIGPIRVFSQELVALRWRASMASAFMMGAGLAFSVVSFVGGYIIVALGYPILFLLGTALVVTGALVFWSCFRVPRGELAGRSCPGVG